MKKLSLIVALVVSASIAFAQDKYEFMTINYAPHLNNLCISIDGKELLEEKFQKAKGEINRFDTNPLLIKVKEYQDKGWEVMNFNSYTLGSIYYICYLRKKKN